MNDPTEILRDLNKAGRMSDTVICVGSFEFFKDWIGQTDPMSKPTEPVEAVMSPHFAGVPVHTTFALQRNEVMLVVNGMPIKKWTIE